MVHDHGRLGNWLAYLTTEFLIEDGFQNFGIDTIESNAYMNRVLIKIILICYYYCFCHLTVALRDICSKWRKNNCANTSTLAGKKDMLHQVPGHPPMNRYIIMRMELALSFVKSRNLPKMRLKVWGLSRIR